jgi:hypothetical protein
MKQHSPMTEQEYNEALANKEKQLPLIVSIATALAIVISVFNWLFN